MVVMFLLFLKSVWFHVLCEHYGLAYFFIQAVNMVQSTYIRSTIYQVRSILSTSELLPCEKSRESNSNAGKMDQTWSRFTMRNIHLMNEVLYVFTHRLLRWSSVYCWLTESEGRHYSLLAVYLCLLHCSPWPGLTDILMTIQLLGTDNASNKTCYANISFLDRVMGAQGGTIEHRQFYC